MNIHSLDTPCLLLDKSRLQNNIDTMNSRIQKLGVALRLHVKTAKCKEVVEMALKGNAQRITASTLKEVSYFFEQGITDIIYAIGIVPDKLKHIAELNARGADVKIILDSPEMVQQVSDKSQELASSFKVMIEIDSDGHRAGIKPGSDLLIDTGKLLADLPGVTPEGVLTHAGASYVSKSVDEIAAYAEQERAETVKSAKRLRDAGLDCPIVSVGSTPTASFAKDLTGVTELRTGVYLFQDLMMNQLGVCSLDDIAVTVLASVIGHQPERNRLLIDAGWTAISGDRGLGDVEDFGVVCDLNGKPIDDLYVCGSSQEHGIVTSRSGNKVDYDRLARGSKVRILPNHACSTATMHDHYKVIQNDTVIDEWKRFDGWYM